MQEQLDRVSAQGSRNKPSFGLQPAQVQPEDVYEGGTARSVIRVLSTTIQCRTTHHLMCTGALEPGGASSESGQHSADGTSQLSQGTVPSITPAGRLPTTCCTAAVTSAREATPARQAASTAERRGAVDPIIQQLLKNARSEAVRQEFLSMPHEEYTSKHDVKVLVSSHQHLQQLTALPQ